MNSKHRFYSELASWWPLISPVEDYTEEAEYMTSILRNSVEIPVREVLELGSGGGHNAIHLRKHFSMTLSDLSPAMLEASQKINPECEHICGDMRTLRLGRTFDAVLIHDAIDYMVSEQDLFEALNTAKIHCKPGGLVVVFPDVTVENFEPSTECGGTDGSDGRAVRYLEWTWDPDPTDSWAQTEYSFLLRYPDGRIETVHESHRGGLFTEKLWMEVIERVGLVPERHLEVTAEQRTPRTFFLGRRPD
jgi:SAM-dependent methyltransferase